MSRQEWEPWKKDAFVKTLETTGKSAAGVWARNGEKQMGNEEKK